MNMRIGLFAAVAVIAGFSSEAALANTIYQMDIEQNGDSAKGTITTDSTIGSLSTANIVNFHIDLNVDGNTFTFDPSSSSVFVNAAGLKATASGLSFDFAAADFTTLAFTEPGGSELCFADLEGLCGGAVSRIVWGVHGDLSEAFIGNGVQQIASVTSTPLPATLTLFVSALGGLGFVGLRRERGAETRSR